MDHSADIKKILKKAHPDVREYIKAIEKKNQSLRRQLIKEMAQNKSLSNENKAYKSRPPVEVKITFHDERPVPPLPTN